MQFLSHTHTLKLYATVQRCHFPLRLDAFHNSFCQWHCIVTHVLHPDQIYIFYFMIANKENHRFMLHSMCAICLFRFHSDWNWNLINCSVVLNAWIDWVLLFTCILTIDFHKTFLFSSLPLHGGTCFGLKTTESTPAPSIDFFFCSTLYPNNWFPLNR